MEKTNIHVCIAGSRGFNGKEAYKELRFVVDDVLTDIMWKANISIISGCADGADSLGEQYATERMFPIVPFPAEWNKYGKAAGVYRNTEMCKYSHIVIVFWDFKSPGSEDMIYQSYFNNRRLLVYDINRHTFREDYMIKLKENQIFVFGSNLAGKHFKGAAKLARYYGAKIGTGHGPMGRTYGIPTKDGYMQPLPLEVIKTYVNIFMDYVRTNPQLEFVMTPIGTGLAGYTIEQLENILPSELPKNVIPTWRKVEKKREAQVPKMLPMVVKETRQ